MDYALMLLPLVIGWILDFCFGDPERLPHPIVGFGCMISFLEHRFNRGGKRRLKGAIVALFLVLSVYGVTAWLLSWIPVYFRIPVEAVGVFYCLAGTTLIREVRNVSKALNVSLSDGRTRVARIVGRDTASLSDHEVRTAALETLAENLSDGVVAPLFWYALLGLPGMMAYKMVNTLDSMIGYRNSRFREFGCFAARMDDVANFIPARLTAFLMILSTGNLRLLPEVCHFGPCHASPNSGWPEAALASVLRCRFGGPHDYFGERVDKPYIGTIDRRLGEADVGRAVSINRRVEAIMVVLTAVMIILLR